MQMSRGVPMSARHGEHLLLAARKDPGALIDALGDPGKERQHPIEIGCDRPSVGPRIGAHQQVLAHRHQREDASRLGHGANSRPDHLMSGPAVDALPVERNGSGARGEQTEDDFHRRRFAAGVAAEQRDDAALANLEREIEMRLHRAIERIDAIEDEQRLGHGPTASVDWAARPTALWPR
jgi:hypothetical protein